MEDAKKHILEEIEDLKEAQRILDLQEFHGDGLYNCRYIAIEGYDDASEQTFYLWRIKEFEVKEDSYESGRINDRRLGASTIFNR